jgi:glycerophosphoryl diester phosphodiesterase
MSTSLRARLFAGAVFIGAAALSASAPAAFAGDAASSSAVAPGIERMRSDVFDRGSVMVVAHRACWHSGPENSLSAIRACWEVGVDVVELDIHRTADGHLVLIHDDTVDRTTNGSGPVAEMTLAQFKALRLREGAGGPGAAVTDEAPPTFAEALESLRGRLFVNIDNKGGVTFLDAIREMKALDMADHAIIRPPLAPDAPELLNTLAEGGPELIYMPMLRERDGTDIRSVSARYRPAPPGFEVYFDNEDYFNAGVPELKAAGARLWVNTLGWSSHFAAGHTDQLAVRDPDAHWGLLIGMGVNMIQTDEPEALLAYLRHCGCDPVRTAHPASR